MSVGWHQDDLYWEDQVRGNAFTVWLALSEVTVDSGPVVFIRGSHRWGRVGGGSFFAEDIEAQRMTLGIPDGAVWDAVPAVLPPGSASLHHRLTVHGSAANTGAGPRRSLAIHMRAGDSEPVRGSHDGEVIHDLVEAPVILGG